MGLPALLDKRWTAFQISLYALHAHQSKPCLVSPDLHRRNRKRGQSMGSPAECGDHYIARTFRHSDLHARLTRRHPLINKRHGELQHPADFMDSQLLPFQHTSSCTFYSSLRVVPVGLSLMPDCLRKVHTQGFATSLCLIACGSSSVSDRGNGMLASVPVAHLAIFPFGHAKDSLYIWFSLPAVDEDCVACV